MDDENKEKKIGIEVSSYLTLQTILLVMYYGFNIEMPWWVVCFPTLFTITIAIGFLLFVLIIFLISN